MPINPPQPSGSTVYGNAEGVLNLVRSLVNDTFAGATNTPGEGRIVIDSAPFVIPLYNNAVNHLQRDLEARGFPSNLRESIIVGLTPVNGPLGPGQSDPTIQPWLGFNGYFDGTTVNPNLALPSNLVTPQRVWERVSVETNNFEEIFETQAGLESRAQNGSLGSFDFRGDALYFNGSTQIMDLRLRYFAVQGLLPPNLQPSPGQTFAQLFSTIAVPWQDSVEPLAYHIAFEFCQSQLPLGQAADLLRGYVSSMTSLAARMVRRSQRVGYHREPYGDTGDVFGLL
ncbi:MAG: hypothetical protein ACREKE_02400 [bacterium]